MNAKYIILEKYNLVEWYTWINTTILGHPHPDALGQPDPIENLYSAYNHLVVKKINTLPFKEASVEVFNSLPKTQLYAKELYTIIQFLGYIKPVEKVDFLLHTFTQGSLNDIKLFENYSANDFLANILFDFSLTAVQEKLKAHFRNGFNTEKTPAFYGLALRFTYSNHKDEFFEYLDNILYIIDSSKKCKEHTEAVVFVMNEMCQSLENYIEILDWWCENCEKMKRDYPKFTRFYIEEILQWLHEQNPEISEHLAASVLRGVMVAEKNNSIDFSISTVKIMTTILEQCCKLKPLKNKFIKYIIDLLSPSYSYQPEEINEWCFEIAETSGTDFAENVTNFRKILMASADASKINICNAA